MIILDTTVVSELMRPSPSRRVVAWVDRHAADELPTTAVTVAEIRFGITRLPEGRRKDALQRVADEIFSEFVNEILPFDHSAAMRYAKLAAGRERRGRPIDGVDGQIAAICSVRGATLATRDAQGFDGCGIATTDPWLAGARG